MSDLDLEAVEQRCQRATPGPWSHRWNEASGEYWRNVMFDDHGGSLVYSTGSAQAYEQAVADGEATWGDDAAFIAFARADIPMLLAEVRRLRALTACEVTAEVDGELVTVYAPSMNAIGQVQKWWRDR